VRMFRQSPGLSNHQPKERKEIMITDTREITLWPSGEKLTCPLQNRQEVVELTLSARFLDFCGVVGSRSHEILKVHALGKELLEAGMFQRPEEAAKNPPARTLEDILRELLEVAGVKFQE